MFSASSLDIKIEVILSGKGVVISSLVIGTDNHVEDRRARWTLGFWKCNSTGFFLSWKTPSSKLKTVRLPRIPWADSAKINSNLIGERIAPIVAPKHKSEFHYQSQIVKNIITEIINQIKVIEVLNS